MDANMGIITAPAIIDALYDGIFIGLVGDELQASKL